MLSKEFRDVKQIYNGKKSVVYRAGYQQKSVIVKTVSTRNTQKRAASLFHEKYIVKKLKHAQGIVKILDVKETNQEVIAIYEDFGGESLTKLLQKHYGDKLFFFNIAIAIAKILREIHLSNIIHKDIKPSNIIVHPHTFEVKITDFGLASYLENRSKEYPQKIQGSPQYISPEQTGLTGKMIDYRSDFYSLGITLYQMLAGVLPFQEEDISQLLYVHSAQYPQPLTNVSDKIPKVLWFIVRKLIDKLPKNRYQTVDALIEDLQQCKKMWKTSGKISAFPLAESDIKVIFEIPDILYGREQERQILQQNFLKMREENNLNIVELISTQGMGKSYLVRYWHTHSSKEQDCLFIHSELFATESEPYALLINAAKELLKHILILPNAQLNKWRDIFRDFFTIHGNTLLSFVPQLNILAPEIFSISDEQKRPNIAWKDFFVIFTHKPLILFFDNIHFCSLETQKWLHFFIKEARQYPVLLILSASHHQKFSMNKVNLSSLRSQNISQILQGTFVNSSINRPALAQSILEKTDGSPLQVIHFLRLLSQKGYLFQQYDRWECDLQKAKALSTQSFHEVWKNLSIDLKEILCFASCINSYFSLNTMQKILNKDCDFLQRQISLIVNIDLLRRQNSFYTISSEKLRDFIYSQITNETKMQLHYQIGMYYYQKNNIFISVQHLNTTFNKLKQLKKLELLIHLNMDVGKKAKLFNNYTLAIEHFENVSLWLRNSDYVADYELCKKLYFEMLECYYLRDDTKQVQIYLEKITDFLRKEDLFSFYHLYCRLTSIKEKYSLSLSVAFKALKTQGENTTLRPSLANIFREIIKNIYYRKNPNQKQTVDSKVVNILAIYNDIIITSSLVSPKLFLYIILRQYNMSLRYGINEYTAVGYVYYAWLIKIFNAPSHKIQNLVQKALELTQNSAQKTVKYRTELQNLTVIAHWYSSFEKLSTSYIRIYKNAYAIGDFSTASYSCIHYIDALLVQGIPLNKVADEVETFFTEDNKLVYKSLIIFRQYVKCLRGKVSTNWQDENFNPTIFISEIQDDMGLQMIYYHSRMIASCILEEYNESLAFFHKFIEKIPLKAGAASNTIFIRDFFFYYFVLLSRLYAESNNHKYKKTIYKEKKRWLKWSKGCEENFIHVYKFTVAEILRIEGKDTQAIRHYLQAIHFARQNKFPNHEAIFCERIAELYEYLGDNEATQTHIKKSYEAYSVWGANAKLAIMRRKYRKWLLQPQITSSPILSDISETITSEKININTILVQNEILAAENDLQPLLKKFLYLTRKTSAAQVVILLLGNDDLKIHAVLDTTKSDQVKFSQCLVDDYQEISSQVVRYTAKTKQITALNSVRNNRDFPAHEYLKKTAAKSLLCIPLCTQSRLVGVLYLENHLMENNFTRTKIEILTILSTQGAIAIHNAQLYTDLRNEIKERKQLEKKVLQISDEEKQRIGRDIHDGLGQYFSAILMTSGAIRRSFCQNNLNKEVKQVDGMIHFIDECMQSVRKISHGLSLLHLQGSELRTALDEIAQNTQKMYHVSCYIDYDKNININNFETVTHLYRIVQESIKNAISHGEADTINIQVKKEAQQRKLIIADNGNGFEETKPRGLGMHTMKSRAELLGGNIDITTIQLQGTTVVCTF